MHQRSAVNFVDFVMLHPHELLLLVSLSSSAARTESDDWTVTAVFFPLFFVSFRHSERWLAMLKSWTCMALNFHHTLGYQPVQQALARFRFRTQNSRYSHSVTSLLQAQFDSDQKMHSWSWTKRFWLSAANMSCHSGLSQLGRKESTKEVFFLGLSKGIICHTMLHHQKFRVNGRKWWLCYNTFGIYSEYLSFGAKAKSFNPCSEAAFERCFTMSSVFLTLQGLVLWVVLHVTFWILTSPIDPPK